MLKLAAFVATTYLLQSSTEMRNSESTKKWKYLVIRGVGSVWWPKRLWPRVVCNCVEDAPAPLAVIVVAKSVVLLLLLLLVEVTLARETNVRQFCTVGSAARLVSAASAWRVNRKRSTDIFPILFIKMYCVYFCTSIILIFVFFRELVTLNEPIRFILHNRNRALHSTALTISWRRKRYAVQANRAKVMTKVNSTYEKKIYVLLKNH